MNQQPDAGPSYAVELARKGIHLCSLSIPIIYYFISKSTALSILIPLTSLLLVIDITRFMFQPVGKLFHFLFGWLLRPHESNEGARRLTGGTYVLMAAVLCIWVFPKVVAITAFAILIISDTSSALVGRRLGKRPFFRKSLEGALAFLASALIVVVLSPKIAYQPLEYLIGAIAAGVGMVVESIASSVDDNILVPLSVGIVMWLLYALLLPHVNVFALDTQT
jgi:dolichol kinase